MKRNVFYHPEFNEIVIADWNKDDFGYTFRTKFKQMQSWKRCPNYSSFLAKGFIYIGKFEENCQRIYLHWKV